MSDGSDPDEASPPRKGGLRVAVTGTPGTGKTSATEALDTDLDVVHLNDVVREEGLTTGRDAERDSLVVDIEATAEWLSGREGVIFESHLAHQFPADRVVVLRCHPEQLEQRLDGTDHAEESITENAESEALDVILTEAVELYGRENVYEIETTDRSIAEVAAAIEDVINGRREPSAGTVSYIDYL
ncbi:adenylate kinase family protein [Halovenus marina]|uniref:adenylate kinase family protein n=1 Tax=Halovenus marina TaxID=3396621 RepID=UPI003F55E382